MGGRKMELLSVREKITRRMVNTKRPEDPLTIAANLEQGVGEAGTANVSISRRRLRELLAQAADLGIAQQVIAAKAAEDVAPFPPRWIRGTLRRPWGSVFGLLFILIFTSPKRRGQQWPESLVEAALGAAGCVLALWLAYRAVLWVRWVRLPSWMR